MNGSGKQSYYEIQLSNGSLIAAFLVAAAVGVTVFVLGVMVGRGQAPEALPETEWVESLAADDGAGSGSGQAPLEEAEPIVDGVGTTDEPDDEADDPGAAPVEDLVAEVEPEAATSQPEATAGLPANDPSLASGWVIQVKATSDETEARALQAQLSRSGFPAFVVQDSRTAMWRVRVGRYGSQDDAEEVNSALSGRTDIASTWVTQG
jgi:cell division septation protein DedD